MSVEDLQRAGRQIEGLVEQGLGSLSTSVAGHHTHQQAARECALAAETGDAARLAATRALERTVNALQLVREQNATINQLLDELPSDEIAPIRVNILTASAMAFLVISQAEHASEAVGTLQDGPAILQDAAGQLSQAPDVSAGSLPHTRRALLAARENTESL